MRNRLWIAVLLIITLACASLPPTLTPVPTRLPTPTNLPPTATEPGVRPSPTPRQVSTQPLPPIAANVTGPFTAHNVSLSHAASPAARPPDYSLPISLDKIANRSVADGLTPAQQAFLQQNGFAVLPSQEAQFIDLRQRVSQYYGQPYYLTTDAAYHALHLTFDELLKALERERLRPQMSAVIQAALTQVLAYLQQVKNTPLESDTTLAAAYLAVALKLFDPQAAIPDASLAARIKPQLDQIKAGAGRDKSILIPNFEDDYGAYKPVGHYAGDPDLEAYFQGMTWLGRVNFLFQDPANPSFAPSRAPLIITLALRQAQIAEGVPASDAWSRVHEILTFLIGHSDDSGPLEVAALMDKVYGSGHRLADLADDGLWKQFIERTSELPGSLINSTFASSSQSLVAQRSWRFMGQRFVIDSFILQNLIYDKVGTQDKKRSVPSGLDVMAVLGSQAALNAQEKAGETSYQNYLEQLALLQKDLNAQPETDWLNHFYSGWLYAFIPQLAGRNASFPPAMQTQAWSYKDLNSALGSWAELKHDTALYTKMPEMMGGGGPPGSGPAPAYVEPNPDVFYRLAFLANALVEGLMERDSTIYGEPATSGSSQLTLNNLVGGMDQLGKTFQQFGQIAEKELAGMPPTSEDDLALIDGCLGPIECAVERARHDGQGDTITMPPVPLIAAVSGSGEDQVLEAATGYLDRIYVVVPLEGKLELAQGGVFSYYEFSQPRSDRLTDQDWRTMLEKKPPEAPAWTTNFILPDGNPVDVLAMRIGDVYKITPAGGNPPLIVHENPASGPPVVGYLKVYDYFIILDGPVVSGGHTWWKISSEWSNIPSGWIWDNPAWYERAYGQ
jgi:hypothetical protein